ncbi:MAG: hypothetical protein KBD64_03515, partial [Gammaproteobacteria bacterium]|nr:hypothetical protein [Gammaproteobacteria bacterium]
VGPSTIGSELELALVDNDTLLPSMTNTDLCYQNALKAKPNNIQPEISRFCLEYNGSVIWTNKQPLNTLANEMELILADLRETALKKYNTKIIPIGIIPTLTTGDLKNNVLTPYWRYHAIDKIMRLMRNNEKFLLNIKGEDHLQLKWPDTALEGVNFSYQVHLRVNPTEYNDLFNSAQAAAAFVLAVSGNSPMLLGHKLWEESRIAVFEQIVNNVGTHPGFLQEQQRVAFGRGWINSGAIGLLKETCELFYPILPQSCRNFPSKDNQTKDRGPELNAIMQHNSSVWPWNRAIYDPAYGGHFRIEMRYLPAGPTVYDMIMNAGFMIGLTKALSNEINTIIPNLPFKYAQYNFYQAAQHGLKATCIWPEKNRLVEQPIIKLLDQMLDWSAFGLQQLGASDLEIRNMQTCIRDRYTKNQTGSIWQRKIYNKLIAKKLNTADALYEMFNLYIKYQQTNLPVSQWSLEI